MVAGRGFIGWGYEISCVLSRGVYIPPYSINTKYVVDIM
jgi:hypothetical protein